MREKLIEKYKESLSHSHGTLVIIVINIVIFIALITIPNLANELLLYPQLDRVIERPWTLVTVFFSHEIHVHLLVNMVLFFFFGSELEKITSLKTIFLVYLITGFSGILITIPLAFIMGWTGSVVGASGAAWGIVATFAVMRPNVRLLGGTAKLYALLLFVGNAILAIINPQISIGAGAHAVGILVGMICGYWLKNKETERRNAIKVN